MSPREAPTALARCLDFCVHLTDEPLAGCAGALDLSVELGGRFGSGHLFKRHALLRELRDLVAHGDNQVSIRRHGRLVHDRSVTWNNLRGWPGKVYGGGEPMHPSFSRAP